MKEKNDLYIEHLKGMVQIPTVSSADPDKTRVDDFKALHAYLEKAYPLVHQHLEKEVWGKAALVFHWKGTGKSKNLPLLLIAHQDVVPEGDHAMWKYPPFSGHVDEDGIMWGRGTTDCKCHIQAELDAVEQLLSEGFTPSCDIYLAFGYNEEIMGGPGAACQIVADEFKARGIQFGMVIDEGPGVSMVDGVPVAIIRTCEKGYADHEFYVDDKGGHAAMPPEHNALGKLGEAMWTLEENPMPLKLCAPVIEMMKAQADSTPGRLGELYRDPEANWEELKELCAKTPSLNTYVRTTTTPTMAKGSDQANILPEHASIITNSRLLPGDTLDDLMAHFKAVLPDYVGVRLVKGHNAPKISSTESVGYRLICKITEDLNPGVKFVPAMVYGGTDSRYYCDLTPTDSVYRYGGGIQSPRSGGAHAVNEHIDATTLYGEVEFFVRVCREYGDAE